MVEIYSVVSHHRVLNFFLLKCEEFQKLRRHYLLEPNLHLPRLDGKGITIPKKFILMLPPFARGFIKSQRDQINKAYQTGGRLVIKPTRKQIEGGFLGKLASIGIPTAISLVSKMFGSGLPAGGWTSS